MIKLNQEHSRALKIDISLVNDSVVEASPKKTADKLATSLEDAITPKSSHVGIGYYNQANHSLRVGYVIALSKLDRHAIMESEVLTLKKELQNSERNLI